MRSCLFISSFQCSRIIRVTYNVPVMTVEFVTILLAFHLALKSGLTKIIYSADSLIALQPILTTHSSAVICEILHATNLSNVQDVAVALEWVPVRGNASVDKLTKLRLTHFSLAHSLTDEIFKMGSSRISIRQKTKG